MSIVDCIVTLIQYLKLQLYKPQFEPNTPLKVSSTLLTNRKECQLSTVNEGSVRRVTAYFQRGSLVHFVFNFHLVKWWNSVLKLRLQISQPMLTINGVEVLLKPVMVSMPFYILHSLKSKLCVSRVHDEDNSRNTRFVPP